MQTHHLPVVQRACCLVYRGFIMFIIFVIHHGRTLIYVTAAFMVCFLHKGSQKNCTDTEGKQYQGPQSQANSSDNSASQIVQVMHRTRKQFAQGQMLNCWQSQTQSQEYKVPRLDCYHWVFFLCLQSLLGALY